MEQEDKIKVVQVLDLKSGMEGTKIEGVEETIVQYLTVPQIVGRWSEYLSEEQIDKLKNGKYGFE